MIKSFFGFEFKDANINSLTTLTQLKLVKSYDFYKNRKGSIVLLDTVNTRLVLVKTFRKTKSKNFFEDLIAEYELSYGILWSASLANKQKLTVEDAKFIFDQSEKQLKDSIDTANNIVLRVNTIIAIIVAIIVGLTSYIIGEWRKTCVFDSILLTSSIGVVYFYFLGFFAVRSIYPTSYFIIGSIPKDLFNDSFFLDIVPNKERIIRYYVSEIENYQFRIERNNFLNGKRWRLYKRILWALLSAPIVFLITYLFIIIFHF